MVSGSLSMASDGTVSHLISKMEWAEIRDDKQEGIDLFSFASCLRLLWRLSGGDWRPHFYRLCVQKSFERPWYYIAILPPSGGYKKLSYRREAARCLVLLSILVSR